MAKLITAKEAAELIRDNSTLASSSSGLAGWAEEIALEIEKRYAETGHPKNITLYQACGTGDWKERGASRLAHEGLVTKLVTSHVGSSPRLQKLVEENKVEFHMFPQGVLLHLARAMASKKSGYFTKVGLGTFVDPRLGGGKITPCTKDERVQLIEINNEEYLFYRSVPVDVALICGSVGDENGNLTTHKQAMQLEALHLAMAVKNRGGIVIAQVENYVKANTLHPQQVIIPGILVDYIVVARPENHMQTHETQFSPVFAGDIKIPLRSIDPMPLDERKIIARRAAMELKLNSIINLGIGMPDGVAKVAAEEGIIDYLKLTTEIGSIGGMPAGGLNFGAAYNAEAIIEHPNMFDFYDGGGLDAAFLGYAQIDADGNVNVSKFGPKVVGCGGFINISQNTNELIFCGAFTSGAETKIEDGKLVIVKEGKHKKFVKAVDHITFSGKYSRSIKQSVKYVTERAVFSLEENGLTLIEIAPGIDMEKDILPMMEFDPIISPDLKEMSLDIFKPQWNKLKTIIK
ncbi:MAG: acyl CoA:acetate/3-ketoacid CoA transferase [Clostridiales bacterium]|nr:acyl CoA:acetate/3-ketoacid CoA transferase [Clostridiales bacterium]